MEDVKLSKEEQGIIDGKVNIFKTLLDNALNPFKSSPPDLATIRKGIKPIVNLYCDYCQYKPILVETDASPDEKDIEIRIKLTRK